MNQFEKIRLDKPKSNGFNLSHEKKLTMNMGTLVPIMCEEVLPGDRFRVNVESLIRMQPMLAPIMHRVNVYTHFFFVPNRIIWNDWEKFITGGATGKDAPVFPRLFGASETFHDTFNVNGTLLGTLSDYLGIPVQNIPHNASEFSVSQLPFRAYLEVYNNYYRDQNLEPAIEYDKGSGIIDFSDAVDLCMLRQRAWEKDYYTSSLPTAQRGDEVLVPVDFTLNNPRLYSNTLDSFVSSANMTTGSDGSVSYGAGTDLDTEIISDSADSSTTITELRRAYALQRFLEKMMRGGSRYVEQMLIMFGVRSSDARHQRPEYLGGGKSPIQISEVLQSSQTETTAQGNMTGHGFSAGVTNGFSRRFEEHGYVIGIMSVLPRTAYMQGLPKIFTKYDRFDYYFPDMAHIGEQEVSKNELYFNPAIPNSVFGYQARYSEYRYKPDTVHGEMRTSLKHWHMARDFSAQPSLNNSFVKSDPTTRIYAVQTLAWQKLICQLYIDFKAIRPVAKFGDPI